MVEVELGALTVEPVTAVKGVQVAAVVEEECFDMLRSACLAAHSCRVEGQQVRRYLGDRHPYPTCLLVYLEPLLQRRLLVWVEWLAGRCVSVLGPPASVRLDRHVVRLFRLSYMHTAQISPCSSDIGRSYSQLLHLRLQNWRRKQNRIL